MSESALDASLLRQTVPPGSMRYYALLFAPTDKRDFIVALHLLGDEIDATAQGLNHEVSHARLRWWSEEIERLLQGRAAHPATRILHRGRAALGKELGLLRGLLEAAALDLAQATYADEAELNAYFDRRGASHAELAARWLLAPLVPSALTLAAVRSLGAAMSSAESLRTFRSHVAAGRVHLPLSGLDQHGIDLTALRETPFPAPVQEFLAKRLEKLRAELTGACARIAAPERAALRPLIVFASLHVRLLDRIGGGLKGSDATRAELGPFEKLWWAWRAARLAR